MLSLAPVTSTFVLIFTPMYLKGDAAPISEGVGTVKCPYNESEWKERSADFFCQGEDVYHCFLSENKVSVKEICMERTMIQKGFCPQTTNDGYLHWARCNQTGCPTVTYVSDEVYKYRVCFGNTDRITFRDEEDKESGGLALGLGLGLGVGIILVIVVSVLVYRKLSRSTKESHDSTYLSRIFHSYEDVTIADEGLCLMSKEISLSCHTCYDTGLRFLRSHP